MTFKRRKIESIIIFRKECSLSDLAPFRLDASANPLLFRQLSRRNINLFSTELNLFN